MSTDNNAISTYSNNKTLALLIFPQIDNVRDLCKVSEVCKTWKWFAYDNSLWKPFVDQFFRHRTQHLDPSSIFVKWFNRIPEKEKFKILFLQKEDQKKWERELVFKAVENLQSVYEIFSVGKYVIVLDMPANISRVYLKENGTEIHDFNNLPADDASFLTLFLANSCSSNPSSACGDYIYFIEEDTIKLSNGKSQILLLSHKSSNEDNSMKVQDCVAFVPNSTLLVSSAIECDNGNDIIATYIFIWDLAQGKCIQRIENNLFSNGSSFFCLYDEHLYVGGFNGIYIMNLQGEEIQFLNCLSGLMVGEIYSIKITDGQIFALDGRGYVHIWKKEQTKTIEEKVDTISNNQGLKKRKNPDS